MHDLYTFMFLHSNIPRTILTDQNGTEVLMNKLAAQELNN